MCTSRSHVVKYLSDMFYKEKTLDSATCVELILIYKRPIRQYLVEVMEPLRGAAFTLSI